MRPIALLTDFGLRDGYVGIMKGAIATIAPTAQCIDLSHDIPPQDLWAGRFCLMNSAPYFPAKTIFLSVIDPGVGSHRRGILIEFQEGFFVGPDNGLASGLLDIFEAIAAVELNNPNYWRSPQQTEISQTFHGRDIFAPVAAHLATGLTIEAFGSPVDLTDLNRLPRLSYHQTSTQITGSIQHIDHFGNLITTIPNHCSEQLSGTIILGDRPLPLVKTYSDVPPHQPCILAGSHGWLEISINQGNAQTLFAQHPGAAITLTLP